MKLECTLAQALCLSWILCALNTSTSEADTGTWMSVPNLKVAFIFTDLNSRLIEVFLSSYFIWTSLSCGFSGLSAVLIPDIPALNCVWF